MYRIDIYYQNLGSTASASNLGSTASASNREDAYASSLEDAVAIAEYYATEGGADITKIYRYRRSGGMRWVGTCIGGIKLFAWGE